MERTELLLKIGSNDPNLWIPNLPEADYHKDKTAVSSSSLRLVDMESPKSFFYRFAKGMELEETNVMKLGRVIHMAILEGDRFINTIKVEPKFEGRTLDGKMSTQSKEAREKKAQWYAELPIGALVVTEEERSMIMGIIESVMSHQDAMTFIKGCNREVSGFYNDPKTGIRCRIRPDLLNTNEGILGDVKSVRSCKKNDFMWQMIRMGWDFQMGMYASGVGIISGKEPFAPMFLAVEKVVPYHVAVYVLDLGSMDFAQKKYHRALEKLKTCIESNQWPSYQERWEHISTPDKIMEFHEMNQGVEEGGEDE